MKVVIELKLVDLSVRLRLCGSMCVNMFVYDICLLCMSGIGLIRWVR